MSVLRQPAAPPTKDAKKPREYCPDGQGGLEERYGVTCTKFGPIQEGYLRVRGRDTVDDQHLDRLGEQITDALADTARAAAAETEALGCEAVAAHERDIANAQATEAIQARRWQAGPSGLTKPLPGTAPAPRRPPGTTPRWPPRSST